MDWELNEEQRMLRSSIEAWADNNYSWTDWRQHSVANETARRARWQELASLGVTGINIDEDHGGLGLGIRELQIIGELSGSYLMFEPFFSTVVLGTSIVSLASSEEQKAAILPAIAEGNCLLAFAFAEHGNRYDLTNVATQLEEHAGQLVLTGKKIAVLDGQFADKIIVLAVDKRQSAGAAGGLVFCLVNRDSLEGRITSYRQIDSRMAADIDFDGVAVADTLAAEDASAVLAEVEAISLVYLAAEAVGSMKAVCEQTLDYLETRQQFGNKLSTYQALRHRFVDMEIEKSACEALAIKAAEAIKQGSQDRFALAIAAKATSGRSARFVGAQGIQLHGGVGMTDELAIGHHYKRLMANEITLGNADYQIGRFRALSLTA